MKPPEKLRKIAIELHTLQVAEGLQSIETTLTHHWRDSQDEPCSASCSVKLNKDMLHITMVIERATTTIYQGPINWLYGVHRYDDEEILD